MIVHDGETGAPILVPLCFTPPQYGIGDCVIINNGKSTTVTIAGIEIKVEKTSSGITTDIIYISMAGVVFRQDQIDKLIRRNPTT